MISRRKEVKCEGKNSAVVETILVLWGHIPHAKGLTFFEEVSAALEMDTQEGREENVGCALQHIVIVQQYCYILYWGYALEHL